MPDVLLTAKAQRWDPAELLRVLLTAEAEGRDHATIEHRRRRAKFPAGKTFTVWDPTRSSIPSPTQEALRTMEWISRGENLVVCGPSGTGKATSAKRSAITPSTRVSQWCGSPSRTSGR